MKRRTDSETEGAEKRRRQPQVSCDSCRKKKLKCDRGDPCSSCVMRGLPCTGQPRSRKPVAQPSNVPASGVGSDDSILGRLRKLEHAVFGSVAAPGASADQPPVDIDPDQEAGRAQSRWSSPGPSPRHPPQRSCLASERQQTARFLDSTFTRNDLDNSLPYDKVDYHVANVSQFPKTPASTTPGLTPTDDSDSRLCTWLMTREEALTLLQDFIDNPFHLLPILYAPAARAMVDNFYTILSRGEEPNPVHAALILAVAATSAFFFDKGSRTIDSFTSTEDATRTALSWFKSALNLLEKPRPSTYSCLEGVQARSVLAYLVYNTEGCSARFRFLHGCSLAAAREICLHLTDSPSSEQQDDVITKEIKRRVWWHITATDWMLGLMGGPTDGTYNVQPRHMNVKLPRNINDDEACISDGAFAMPSDTATTMSCFIKRIQLSEIARSIIDARAPGVPDAEITDYDQVLELDRLFEDAFSDFPPFLHPDGPIPPDAPRCLAFQRDVVLLGFHSRRARLHRPLLLHEKQDAQYRLSRETCLRSARTALSISTTLLQASHAKEPVSDLGVRAIGCRIGCVIGHTFMACTILALNAGLDSGRGAPAVGEAGVPAGSTAETHAEVARACRALASAGEESEVAGKLMRNLVGVLRRYRVQGVDDVVSSESRLAASSSAEAPGEVTEDNSAINKQADGKNGGYDVGYSSMLGGDDLGLDELWNDILVDTTTAGWDQLFAGLDTYCGPT